MVLASSMCQPHSSPIYYSASTPVYYPPAAYGLPTAAPGMTQMLGNTLRVQIEYYFSPENLQKDFYIRSNMDDHGWVLATVVAQFNRVRRLTPDLTIVVGAVTGSSIVETSPDGTYFRAHDNPEQWVLPVERRDPTVQQRKVPVTMFSPSGAAVTALVPQPPRSQPSRTSSGSSRAGFEQALSGPGSAAGGKQRRRSTDGSLGSLPQPPPPPTQQRASTEVDGLKKREVRLLGTLSTPCKLAQHPISAQLTPMPPSVTMSWARHATLAFSPMRWCAGEERQRCASSCCCGRC